MVKATPPPAPAPLPLPPPPPPPQLPPRPQAQTIPPEGRRNEEITANRRRELVPAGPSMGTKVTVGVLVFLGVLLLGTAGIMILQRVGGH